MKDLKIDAAVMVTSDSFNLVDHEKALVTLWPGCIWSYLKQDETIVGIAFAGTAKFAVDAFAQTSEGVIGESKAGALSGIQIYLGASEIATKSTDISQGSVESCGYSNVDDFHSTIEKRLGKNFANETTKFDFDAKAIIFLGQDEDEKDITMVTTKEGLVFTHDKVVSVLSGDGIVLVDGKRVSIGGKHGRTLNIDEEGIHGLEELGLIGHKIGRRVNEIVTKRLSAIRIPPISPIPHFSAHYHDSTYDNVDDFDFDTYPDLKEYSLHRGR